MAESEELKKQEDKKEDEKKSVKPEDRPLPADKDVTSEHELAGYRYRATAGTLSIETKNVAPAASMFHVDYLKLDEQGNPDPTRPVTFIFNGGPGSATTFLLMGSFAPRRIDTGEVVSGHGAPYSLEDNKYTLLPFTDLVFIDAPGAGFSRIAPAAKKELWSVDGDVAAFSQFIRRWASKYNRWNSPKYLFGESYGTVRGAALSLKLQEDGCALSGVTLISNILDYAHTFSNDDQLYIGYFPTYATTAFYHGLAGKGLTVEQQAQRAREFANGAYRAALSMGDSLSEEQFNAVASEYAHLTGLSADYVRKSNLRVGVERFSKELLRESSQVVGLYDSRVTGYDLDQAGSEETFLADDAFITPHYVALCEQYLKEELGWQSSDLRRDFADLDLESREPGKSWDWHHKKPYGVYGDWDYFPFPRVIEDLATAIVHEPGLKVMIGNGYYDLCTPMFQTEFDIDHLQLPRPLRHNVAFSYYPAGHMLYTAPQALPHLYETMEKFYAAAPGDVSALNERPELPLK